MGTTVKTPSEPRTATKSTASKVVPAPSTKSDAKGTSNGPVVRTSHVDCDHPKSGREGKIDRAKCRREHATPAKDAA